MTTLYEAMQARLRRFVDGEADCQPSTRAFLSSTAQLRAVDARALSSTARAADGQSDERTVPVPIVDILAWRFHYAVHEWVNPSVSDDDLREAILSDVEFLAARWPVKTFAARIENTLSLTGKNTGALLDGLCDPDLVETYLVEGEIPIVNWPKGADLEAVLRWWVDTYDLSKEPCRPGSKHGVLKRDLGDRSLNALLWYQAERRGTEPEPWKIREDVVFPSTPSTVVAAIKSLPIESETSLDPRAAAVVFLAEQRARPRVQTRRILDELTRADEHGARLRHQAAEDALRLEEASTFDASDRRVIDELAAELRARLSVLRDVGFDGNPTEMEDGILVHDARFARYVEKIGPTGAMLAADVREAAAKRTATYQAEKRAGVLWSMWTEKRFLTPLAQVLWADVVSHRVRKAPALVRPVYAATLDFHSRGRVFEQESGQLTFDGHEIASLVTTGNVNLALVENGLSLLGSVVAHKVFRWEIFTGHERSVRQEPYAHVLEIDGGWTELARVLGLNPEKHAHSVRSVVYAQAHFSFTFPDGSRGNMLSYTEKAAAGRNERARVTITLGSPLLPGYQAAVAEAKGRVATSKARMLVPVPRSLPPLTSRPNEHGQQISFGLAVMAEFRERAVEMAERGAIELTHDTLTRLADRASLPRRLILPVIDIWQKGTPDAAPYLHRVAPDVYDLADAYRHERQFILEAGRQSKAGAVRGREGARRRAATIRGGRKK